MCVIFLKFLRSASRFNTSYYFATVSVLFYFFAGIIHQAELSSQKPSDIEKCPKEWSNASQYENRRRIANLVNNSLQEINLKNSQQKFGCIPGDVMIGVISPVHKRSGRILNDDEQSYFLKCGTETDFSTTITIQFLLMILDTVTDEHYSARGFSIGAFILDNCDSDIVAQYQIMRLLESTSPNSDNFTLKVSCSPNGSVLQGPVIGIVGTSDTVGFPHDVQGLLNTLKYPITRMIQTFETKEVIANQVENRSWYTFTDNFIIFNLLKHFGWTYISLIFTEEYHDLGQFHILAEHLKVCIAKVEKVHPALDSDYYTNLIKTINVNKNAKAVVCFLKGDEIINKVFQAVNDLNMTDRFIFISSGEWSSHADVIFDKLAYSPKLLTFHKSVAFESKKEEVRVWQEFVDKYFRINERSTRNPWLIEAWQNEFNCSFNETGDLGKWPRQCTGEEVTVEHINNPMTRRSLAHMMADVHYFYSFSSWYANIEQCVGRRQKEKDECRKRFFESIKDVSSKARTDYFCWIQNKVVDVTAYSSIVGILQFDESFDIIVHQKSSYDRINSILIGQGKWDKGNKKMNVTIDEDKSNLKYVRSVCSEMCSFGYKKVISNPATPCCWTCERCLDNEILYNDNYCLSCGEKKWPNMNQTECVEMKVMRINWMNLEGIFCLSYAVIVITFACGCITIFIKYQNTPVVKSSTKELSFIMLIAVIAANCVVFIKIKDCTVVTCTATRILMPLSLSAIYSALLVKTVRIARLLALSKNKFPKLNAQFMSTKSQVVMTVTLLSVKMSLIYVGLYFEPADVLSIEVDIDDGQPVIKYACSFNTNIVIVNYIFPTVLVLLCTMGAVWTRNVPDNFNEAKYIGFSMYATCITWFGFILAQYQTEMEILTLCFSSSTSTFIILIFLFFPKIYVILWRPEENDRRFFMTSSDIRIHVGRLMSKRYVRSSGHTETSISAVDEKLRLRGTPTR